VINTDISLDQALIETKFDMVWYWYKSGRKQKFFRKENLTFGLLKDSEYKGTTDRYIILEGGPISP